MSVAEAMRRGLSGSAMETEVESSCVSSVACWLISVSVGMGGGGGRVAGEREGWSEEGR